VTDDGRPFNPLELTPPDTNLPVEDRPIGGLGIHLLRKLSDRMEYARIEGKNRLTLWEAIRRLGPQLKCDVEGEKLRIDELTSKAELSTVLGIANAQP
jgi:hypothetical protein